MAGWDEVPFGKCAECARRAEAVCGEMAVEGDVRSGMWWVWEANAAMRGRYAGARGSGDIEEMRSIY